MDKETRSHPLSFYFLLGAVLIFTALFYQVMAPFLLPLFLAGVLVLLFRPWNQWISAQCGGREKLASVLSTLAVVLVVLVPICGTLTMAALQLVDLVDSVDIGRDLMVESNKDEDVVEKGVMNQWMSRVPPGLREWIEPIMDRLNLPQERIETAVGSILGFVAQRTVELLGGLVGFIVALLITVISMYYFFLDGTRIVATLQRLTPLEDRHERELITQFDRVCRAVVFATLASACVQGLLAGAGFVAVGLGRHVFLLTIVTTFFAMIPFLGTAVVWAPVCIILFFQGHPVYAIGLAVWGGLFVAQSDNFVKPWILSGSAGLHPLLALLSVLGGVRVLGLWGIFIGPMVAAFLYSLLNILHRELEPAGEGPSSDNEKTVTLPDNSPTEDPVLKAKSEARSESSMGR